MLATFGQFKKFISQVSIAHLASALAFNVLLAVVPLLFVTLVLGSFLFQNIETAQLIEGFFLETFGQDAAVIFSQLMKSATALQGRFVASLIGFIIVAVALMRILGEIRLVSEFILRRKTVKKRRPVSYLALQYIEGFLVLLISLILLLTVLVLRTFISVDIGAALAALPIVKEGLFLLGIIVSILLLSSFYTVLYRLLSRGELSWRSAWWGALMAGSSVVFLNELFALAVKLTGAFSIYGIAGPLIAFIIWTYQVMLVSILGGAIAAFLQYRKQLTPKN